MAKATKVPVDDWSVHLELSREETRTLFELLEYVGGSPDTTRRKYAQAIYQALNSLEETSSFLYDIKGSITFL